MSKTYTKAKISKDTLVNLFGIEFGLIDCTTNTVDKLEQAVDNACSKQEITESKWNE